MSLAELFQTAARAHARRLAVTDVRTDQSLTYGDLAAEAARVAAFLGRQGVRPGHRVALTCPNGLAYLPAAFGLLACGACVVPLAVNLTPSEAAQVLSELDVNAALSSPGTTPAAADASIAGGACDGFAFAWIDRDAAGPPGLAGLDPAFIRFTSGTTARSKGVVISHGATVARVDAADRVLRFTADDRVVWVLPLAYHFAVTIVAYVRAGAHVLMCPDTLPGSVLDTARRFEASVLYASPLHFERLGNLEPSDALKSLRLAVSTSAPISEAVTRRFEAAYGMPLAQAYGIIEAGLPCINARTTGLPPTSVGPPVPGYEVALFDEDGARARADEPGEVAVRGPGLFSAYYAPWQPREALTRDGWFFTGDVGRLDASGALSLLGRRKAMIFVAGVKFFPEEVEACINRFEGVRESRVFGAPHPRLGQVPRAEIVPSGEACDVAALAAHCAHRLSPYKVPVDFTVVAALAKTPGGKILRR